MSRQSDELEQLLKRLQESQLEDSDLSLVLEYAYNLLIKGENYLQQAFYNLSYAESILRDIEEKQKKDQLYYITIKQRITPMQIDINRNINRYDKIFNQLYKIVQKMFGLLDLLSKPKSDKIIHLPRKKSDKIIHLPRKKDEK